MLSQAALPVTLDHFLASLDGLPNELKQNLTSMQNLDERTQRLVRETDDMTSDYIRNSKQLSKINRRDATANIRKLYEHCCSMADEKVNLANQAYELVDGHIRRLDETLSRFEADFRSNMANYQNVPGSKPTFSETTSNNAVPVGKKRKQDSLTPNLSKKKSKTELEGKKGIHQESPPEPSVPAAAQWASLMKQATAGLDSGSMPATAQGNVPPGGSGVPDSVLDMPVDPNEPTYCLCHQVSYGEMIGCDNPDCPIEWFHFGCMGLSEQPSGEWFCPRCSPLMEQSGVQRNSTVGKKRKALAAKK